MLLLSIGDFVSKEIASMLDVPTSAQPVTEIRASGRVADRAMDILQYGLAILAIVGALLLGTVR
jgi:hypothetical protein